MAGLFSGAGQDLAASEENLGQTLFKAGMTIYDKLNDAEMVSQFNVGQTQLTNAMNQFDYQRSTKGSSDFLNWQDQNTKAQDEAWSTIEKTLKNQGAKNQLHDWWQSQKIERSRKIEGEVIGARIDTLRGNSDSNVTSIRKLNEPYDVQMSKIGKQYDDDVRTGVRLPAEAAQLKVKEFHNIEYEDLKRKAVDNIIQSGGDILSGLKYVNDNAGQYDYLNEDDAGKISDYAMKQGKLLVDAANAKTKREDDALYNDSEDKIIAQFAPKEPGDKPVPLFGLNEIDSLKWGNPVASKTNASSLTSLFERLSKESKGRGSGSAKRTAPQAIGFADWYQKINDGLTDEAQAKKELTADLTADKLTVPDYIKLRDMTSQETGPLGKFKAEGVRMLKSGLIKPDGSGVYDEDVLGASMELLDGYITANKGTLKGNDIVHYAEELKDKKTAQAIDDAIKNQFTTQGLVSKIFNGEYNSKDMVQFLSGIKNTDNPKGVYAPNATDKTIRQMYEGANLHLMKQLANKNITDGTFVDNSDPGFSEITKITGGYPAMISKDGGTLYRIRSDKGKVLIEETKGKNDKGYVWTSVN